MANIEVYYEVQQRKDGLITFGKQEKLCQGWV
jgi:hypothetical protein